MFSDNIGPMVLFGGGGTMKHFFRLCQIVSVFLLFGCIPSVNPIYTDNDIVFDEDLVGVWEVVGEVEDYSWKTH